MNMIELLRKAAVFFETRKDSLFTYSVEKQKEYMDSFREPIDGIERSYFQYKCQMKLNGVWMAAVLNLLSCPLYYFLRYKYAGQERKGERNKVSAVFFRDGKPANIMPDSLWAEFPDVITDPGEGNMLKKSDIAFLKQVRGRYPFAYQFLLKSMIKVARYRYALENYAPKAIIVCAEYSFTSSLLTAYCKAQGVEHIDVMHGDKLFHMHDSFFKFDRCYVWDPFYAGLLTELRAEKNQFRIEKPQSIIFHQAQRNIEVDFTYYLGNETPKILEKIADTLKGLKSKGYRVCIRPHPRYSNFEMVKKLFSQIEIEDCSAITVEESLLRTQHAVSLMSTVLFQALNNNIKIVIDDVNDRSKYEKLKELRFVCLNKEHQLLSEYKGSFRRTLNEDIHDD